MLLTLAYLCQQHHTSAKCSPSMQIVGHNSPDECKQGVLNTSSAFMREFGVPVSAPPARNVCTNRTGKVRHAGQLPGLKRQDVCALLTVYYDLGDQDAADGPRIGYKIEGALQGGHAPGHCGLPLGEQRASAQRSVQRPYQTSRRHHLHGST